MKILLSDWERNWSHPIECNVSHIGQIEFNYDGGRLTVYINGDEVVHDVVSHDFSLEILND